jgi:hypothetical protein
MLKRSPLPAYLPLNAWLENELRNHIPLGDIHAAYHDLPRISTPGWELIRRSHLEERFPIVKDLELEHPEELSVENLPTMSFETLKSSVKIVRKEQPSPNPVHDREQSPSPARDVARQERRGGPLPKQEPASQVEKGSVSSRKKRGSYDAKQRKRARKVLQRIFPDKEYPAKDDVDVEDLKKRFNETYNKMVAAGQLPRAIGGAPSWSTVERELGWKDTEQ